MKQNLIILIFFVIIASSCSETENKKQNISEEKVEQNEIRKDIKFTANSQSIVEAGEVFQVIYKLNEKSESFNPPDFKDFELVAGPFTSSSSSIQIINGETSRSVSNSYTYNISCQKPGTYIIAPAEVTISGNTYKSNTLKIKVIGDEIKQNDTNISHNQKNNNSIKPNKEIFLQTTYSATSVYKGDYIIATTKLYTRKDFQNINEIKFPDYDKFWKEELKAPRQLNFRNEEHDGKIYQVALIKQVLLFTQKPGKFNISPYEIELQIKKKDGKARDFFGNIVDHYKLINKRIKTKKQLITVRPLPQPIPEKFSGLTGSNIELIASIDNEHIKTDQSASLKVTVSGKGNLYLLNELELQLPDGISSFKPKVTKTKKYSDKGAFAEKEFNYTIVGNKVGTYEMPINFVYFDTNLEKYKTLTNSDIHIIIEKGNAYNISENNDIITDNKDIRYIKNSTKLKKINDLFAGSIFYWLIIASLFLFYVILLIIRKKHIEESKDIIKVKRKNASKVSQKRLKIALKYMNKNNEKEFYKEILTSIWGYISDKMSVNSDELTNENIQKLLQEKNIDKNTIKKLINIVELCGYAQYSPAGEEAKPKNIYSETESIINELERSL